MTEDPSPRCNEAVLVTGGTGFVGREVVRRLIACRPGAPVVLLVRPRPRVGGVRTVMADIARDWSVAERSAAASRVSVVEGDVTLERCGMAPHTWNRVVGDVTRVVHAAASVRLDLPLAEARRVNVAGTRQALALAEAIRTEGHLAQFTYVGTAFVAGRRSGPVLEGELDVGQRFRNAYEESKCEAESLVRAARQTLPTVIVRPSIVVGDSTTGVTRGFRTIYWPLRVYASGRWRTVPGFAETVLDLVPVDFVAAAIAHLVFNPDAVGKCAHLCAGPDGSITVGEVGRIAAAVFAQPPPRFVHPALFPAFLRPLIRLVSGRKSNFLRDARVYRPYFRMTSQFDTATARSLLEPAGIAPPPARDYVERLLTYCRDSDWGRVAGGSG